MMLVMNAPQSPAIKKTIRAVCLAVVLALSIPSTSLARNDDEDQPKEYDARILGYTQDVDLKTGSTALSWLLLIALGVVSVAVLFKDAKRSHLD
jgi:hypothetical protein